MTARRTLTGTVVMVVVLLCGCAVEPESRAHVISPDDVPYDLLTDDRRPTTTSTAPDDATVTIYLVRDDELVPVERPLAPDGSALDLLALLGRGPDEAERSVGLGSPIPDEGAFQEVEIVRGVAEVALGRGFVDLAGEEQVLAIGQSVLTLTGRPGIGRVGFTYDGEPVEAPTGDGSVTSEPIARDDFADLVADA